MKTANPKNVNKSGSEEGATAERLDPTKFSLKFGMEVDELQELKSAMVGRPKTRTFFRTHPDPSYTVHVGIIEPSPDGRPYLVLPDLLEMGRHTNVTGARIYTTFTRDGEPRLWPVRLPDEDGGHSDWSRTAYEAAEAAKTDWIQISLDPPFGRYRIHRAATDLGDPGLERIPPFADLFNSAFGEQAVTKLNHPVVRWLNGLSEYDRYEHCSRS